MTLLPRAATSTPTAFGPAGRAGTACLGRAESSGLVEFVPGRHDHHQIDVAVLVGGAPGPRAEQDDLLGMEPLGDLPRVPADHPHRDVGPPVVALRRHTPI